MLFPDPSCTLRTAPNTSKVSCHISKIQLFVKEKNATAAFFSPEPFGVAARPAGRRPASSRRLFFRCAIYSFFHQMQVKIEPREKKLYFHGRVF